MSERSVTAQPGLAPGSRRDAGTMFAALYGELVPHPWRDPESELDAYSLFYHRSVAMGWLDDRGAGGTHRPAYCVRPGCGACTTPGGNTPSPLLGRD